MLLVLLVVLGACATTTAGTPTRAPRIGPDGPLAEVDPCLTLSSAQLRELGAEPGDPTDIPGARGCVWITPPSGGFFVLLHNTAAPYGGPFPLTTLHDRITYRVPNSNGPGTCSIVIPITRHSAASTDVLFRIRSTTPACELADHVADLVAPRLPAT